MLVDIWCLSTSQRLAWSSLIDGYTGSGFKVSAVMRDKRNEWQDMYLYEFTTWSLKK